jgi:hypothetical protein
LARSMRFLTTVPLPQFGGPSNTALHGCGKFNLPLPVYHFSWNPLSGFFSAMILFGSLTSEMILS